MPFDGLQGALDWLVGFGEAPALLVLTLTSAVEYVFPPFPGDTVTLAGAVLATHGGWGMAGVFTATTLGSLAGAAVDFAAGRMLERRRTDGSLGRRWRDSAGMERIHAGFRRWGPAFIAVNRFLPGIRALFFVAAGMAGLRFGPVLLYALLSALAWNALIILLGHMIGANVELLEAVARTYASVLWALLALACLALTLRWLMKRKRQQ